MVVLQHCFEFLKISIHPLYIVSMVSIACWTQWSRALFSPREQKNSFTCGQKCGRTVDEETAMSLRYTGRPARNLWSSNLTLGLPPPFTPHSTPRTVFYKGFIAAGSHKLRKTTFKFNCKKNTAERTVNVVRGDVSGSCSFNKALQPFKPRHPQAGWQRFSADATGENEHPLLCLMAALPRNTSSPD